MWNQYISKIDCNKNNIYIFVSNITKKVKINEQNYIFFFIGNTISLATKNILNDLI